MESMYSQVIKIALFYLFNYLKPQINYNEFVTGICISRSFLETKFYNLSRFFLYTRVYLYHLQVF